jgi:hypothetical protein
MLLPKPASSLNLDYVHQGFDIYSERYLDTGIESRRQGCFRHSQRDGSVLLSSPRRRRTQRTFPRRQSRSFNRSPRSFLQHHRPRPHHIQA